MLKKLLPSVALAALSLLAAPATQAQTPDGWRPCASDVLQEQYFAQHPEARREHQRILQMAEASLQAQQRGGLNTTLLDPADTLTNVVVPVVVHVLYYGIPANNTVPPSYITDRQINDAMAILNRDFSRKNPDTTDIIPFFKSRIANPGFKFRLAKLDPNGNCTTGITRHYTPETYYGTASATSIVYWPANKYLNLWIVDGISSGAGGYTFGSRDCNANDGIVLRRAQFGPNTACTANLCTRSLTHEVGHYFSLNHTWGRTNTPGLASNCSDDDGVTDTPNTVGVSGQACPTTMPSCVPGVLANVQNYMDYADCEKMFTVGQKAVMRASLVNNSCRRNLISAANLVATGTNDGFVATPCAPVVFFNPTKTTTCEGGTVQFRDYSYNVNSSSGGVTYAWSFPGGTPATAATVAPTVTYATAGVYDVTLTVTSLRGGTSSYTSTQLIRVNGPNSAEFAPLDESFEDPNAPFNYTGTAQQRNYTTSYTSAATYSLNGGWQRRTTSTIPAADGIAYLQVPNQQLPAGTVSILTTPNINLAYITSPVLSFSEYFEPRYNGPTSFSNLNLRIQLSNDCGLNWNPISTYTATQLGTANSAGPVPSAPSDWRTLTLPIPTQYHGSGTFQVRFILTNTTASAGGQDNNFFFDKLAITGPLGTHAAALAQRGISVFPNPLTNETAVHLTLPATTAVQVRLTDVLGREVLTLPAKTYPAGEQTISLASATNGLPAGVYVVRITLDGQTYTSKLAVQ